VVAALPTLGVELLLQATWVVHILNGGSGGIFSEGVKEKKIVTCGTASIHKNLERNVHLAFVANCSVVFSIS